MSHVLRAASLADLPAHLREQVQRKLGPTTAHRPPPETKKSGRRRGKYGAEPVHVDGIRFDSKREARRFEQLRLLVQSGEVERFHRQVIFDLPGDVQYRCDFQVVYPDGRVVYEDAKGVETKEFKLKRRQVRALYGVEIVLV